jgi:hypothetical protein
LDLALFDVVRLLFAILLLAHDLQVIALVLRLRVQLEECLLQFFCLELDENATLEQFVIGASQADCFGGTVCAKEGLDVELCTWDLFAETLDIHTTGHCGIFEDGDLVRIIPILRQFLSSDTGVIVCELDKGRFPQCLDNCLKGLEVAHAFEVVDLCQVN